MKFTWDIDAGQIMVALSFVGSVVLATWKMRGWVDDFKEGMKQRHRQNTLRMDFMLLKINKQREDEGKAPIECPYRLITDV